MQLTQYNYLSGRVVHACGEILKFDMAVIGDGSFLPQATMDDERFTFTASFAKVHVYFKAHGTRIKYCPKCKKPLPRTLEDVRDEDFQGHA